MFAGPCLKRLGRTFWNRCLKDSQSWMLPTCCRQPTCRTPAIAHESDGIDQNMSVEMDGSWLIKGHEIKLCSPSSWPIVSIRFEIKVFLTRGCL